MDERARFRPAVGDKEGGCLPSPHPAHRAVSLSPPLPGHLGSSAPEGPEKVPRSRRGGSGGKCVTRGAPRPTPPGHVGPAGQSLHLGRRTGRIGSDRIGSDLGEMGTLGQLLLWLQLCGRPGTRGTGSLRPSPGSGLGPGSGGTVWEPSAAPALVCHRARVSAGLAACLSLPIPRPGALKTAAQSLLASQPFSFAPWGALPAKALSGPDRTPLGNPLDPKTVRRSELPRPLVEIVLDGRHSLLQLGKLGAGWGDDLDQRPIVGPV